MLYYGKSIFKGNPALAVYYNKTFNGLPPDKMDPHPFGYKNTKKVSQKETMDQWSTRNPIILCDAPSNISQNVGEKY
jgi:hypothetical protein